MTATNNMVNNLGTYHLDDSAFMNKLTELPKETKEVMTKLTDWKNEPKLNQLRYDLEQSKNSHSKFTSNLAKWENLYNAPKFGDAKHKGSRIVPKLVRKQAEWRCPALSEPFLSTLSLFDVKPLTHEDTVRAKQNALILNMQFNTQLNKTKLVDNIIRSVVKNGTAIVRLGWEFKEEEVEETLPTFKYNPVPQEMVEEISKRYEEYNQLKQTEPDSYEQLPEEMKAGLEMSMQKQMLLFAVRDGEVSRKIKKAVINKPTAEICNLRNVYIDPTCKGDLDKAQFVIHSYESSLADLKKAGYYKNLEFINQNDALLNGLHDRTSDFIFSDNARKKIVVYEYWGYWDIDGNGETKAIVASWVGNTLIRLDENPFPDKKVPFVVFNYLPEEDEIYGIPDAELLEDNQAILGAVMRGSIDLLGKSANSQTGFSKNFLDPSNKVRFMKGLDYEYNPNFDPRIHVYTHKFPEIPNSAMHMINMMNGEAEAISGVKAFSGSGGITASYLGETAAGARGVLDAVSKREMSILRRISDGFIVMGRKIISMNGVFLSEEEVVRVTNHEFIRVRRDDLLGNFDLSLTISTAEADDAKAKELSYMLQTLGNNMGQGITQLIFSEIATLRKMPDLAHKILNHKVEPDPMQQQLQELEIQRLQAEIDLLKSQAQENYAQSQVQQAKVGTEKAKADNLQSDADNKTLDFMERDSGLKHQHELEKQSLNNDALLNQQLLKNQAQEQQQINQHNSDLLKQYAQNSIAGDTVTRM